MITFKKKYIFSILLIGILVNSHIQASNPEATSKAQIKKIVIASEPDYPPYCIVDKNGNADGFSVDLFKAAAKAVNIEVEIKIGIWNQIKQDLAEGKIDALPLVGRTPEREILYDFTFPYLTLHGAIFVREGTTGIKTVADLKDKKIVVMKGDNAEEYVRRANISKYIYTTHTFGEAFSDLANGEYDAVITQRVLGLQLLKEMNLETIIPLDINLDEFRQDFCFAVKKGNKELLSRLSEGLSIVIANKTYDRLHVKWFGPNLQGQIALKDAVRIALYVLIPLIILFSLVSIVILRSEVKKRTAKLQESEEHFRAIFEQAAVGVALLNTETGQFIRINQKYCDFVGYTMQEMLQKTLMDITYDEDIKTNLEKNRLLIEKNEREYSLEKRYVHKDGTIIWGSLTISPLWKSGEKPETYFHIAIVEDITERKQSELIISQQNKQLHEVNATKDKFFSIIAHDLRSPFQGFLGMTKMMAENSGEFSTEESSKLSKEMNQSAENLFKLLQNLLEWARIQNGTMDFTPGDFVLKEIVDDNLEAIKQSAKQKGITITNEVTEELMVFVDERMLRSILSNLISNAVKFTRRGGEVTLKAKTVPNNLVEISVADTGIGLSESTLNKLFKIDEKVGRKGTDGEPSTGLGLLLCKEFVEKHGGKIWAESEKEKGSTFYFTVPAKEIIHNLSR
ncbi:MAG: transporter substrate-binding domain-containing protein [Ignavibacteriaceae bacterium]|jgi:PAS domain S-box-containing protein